MSAPAGKVMDLAVRRAWAPLAVLLFVNDLVIEPNIRKHAGPPFPRELNGEQPTAGTLRIADQPQGSQQSVIFLDKCFDEVAMLDKPTGQGAAGGL